MRRRSLVVIKDDDDLSSDSDSSTSSTVRVDDGKKLEALSLQLKELAMRAGDEPPEKELGLEDLVEIDVRAAGEQEGSVEGDGVEKIIGEVPVVDAQIPDAYTVNALNRLTDDRTKEVARWLSPFDHWVYHRELLVRRVSGTGRRFLEGEEFQTWCYTGSGVLWVTGILGSGKTYLASHCIDFIYPTLDESLGTKAAVVFAYCWYTDNPTAKDVLRTFIRQIMEVHSSVHSVVLPVWEEHLKGATLSTADAKAMLQAIIPLFESVEAVVDGLDEMDSDEREALLRILSGMQVKLLLFSRRLDPLFMKVFSTAKTMVVKADDEDVRALVEKRLKDSFISRRYRLDEAFKKTIADKIVEQSAGTFLVATLQLDIMEKYQGTEEGLINLLDSPPSGLDGMYAAMVQRIRNQKKSMEWLGLRALIWVAHAERPLTMDELQCALMVSLDGYSYDEDARETPATILMACCGMITWVPSGQDFKQAVIQPIHPTVKEYVRRLDISPFSESHSIMAVSCAAYLTKFNSCPLPMPHLPAGNEEPWSDQATLHSAQLRFSIVDSLPFGDYAYRYLCVHASRVPRTDIEALSKIAYCLGQCKYLGLINNSGLPNSLGTFNPFSFAAYHGAFNLLPYLNLPSHSEGNYHNGQSTVHFVARLGSAEALSYVLERDVDVNALDNDGDTPLHTAIRHDDARGSVVEILLAQPGIQVNFPNRQGKSPLYVAVQHGKTKLVELLLGHPDIRVNPLPSVGPPRDPDTELLPILHVAIRYHFISIIEKLVARKELDVNVRDADGVPALHLAIWRPFGRGCPDARCLAALITREDLDVTVRVEHFGHTPWTLVMQCDDLVDREEKVELLLSHPGIDPNQRDGDGLSALARAARAGDVPVGKLLLAHPLIDPNVAGLDGMTPLMHAQACSDDSKKEEFISLLLEHPKIDTSAFNDAGLTALGLAVKNCDITTCRILLSHPRLDATLADSKGSIPLLEVQAHSIESAPLAKEGIVRLLLDHPQTNPNVRGPAGFTPLTLAISENDLSTIQLLLNHPQINVNFPGTEGDTPLTEALKSCEQGPERDAVVQLLLAHPAIDPNAPGEGGATPLILAIQQGDVPSCRALLAHNKIDVNRADRSGATPLVVACDTVVGDGRVEITEMLLSHPKISLD